MTTDKFVIRWANEDYGRVFLGESYLFDIDYIPLGRAGMTELENAIRLIARRFGATVETEWEIDEEDD